VEFSESIKRVVAIDWKLYTKMGATIDGKPDKLDTIKKGCSISADPEFSDTIKVVLMLIK